MKTGKKSFFIRVKSQFNGTYPVHSEDCPFLPDDQNRIYLGEFSTYAEALFSTRFYFPEASKCNFCAKQSMMADNNLIINRSKRKFILNSSDSSDLINLDNLKTNN